MRIKDIKKASLYFLRILKNPFSKQNRTALKRYFCEIGVLMCEKIKGIDFTMVYQCNDNKHNNNYSKSPKQVLKKIFDDISFDRPHSFIDMGCGKGYVLVCAAAYPFTDVGGVEYNLELYNICQRNLKKLGYDNIKTFNCDAKIFDGYEDYDIYYFCNPFDETILSVVAKKIIEAHKDGKCWIYYLNPHQPERQKAITDAGFKLVKIIEDKNEMYFDINVYSNLN